MTLVPTYKKITLCGSTRFKEAWLYFNAFLTLREKALVYSVAMWSHSEKIEPSLEQKRLLDSIHKGKIRASDEVFVLDVDGYIGASTSSEISFADGCGLRVRFLSEEYPDWTPETRLEIEKL